MNRRLFLFFILFGTTNISAMHHEELFKALTDGDTDSALSELTEEAYAVVDQFGNTVLHLAAESGMEEVVRHCIQKGVSLEARNAASRRFQDDCCTALHLATRNGHDDCTRILLEAGADTEARDLFGHTAIHNASWKNHPGCLALLLKAHAKVNVQDIRGGTALNWASLYGFDEIIILLLNANADCLIPDKCGHLPIHHAAFYRGTPEQIARYAEVAPSCITALDKRGCSPAQRAMWSGRLDCLNVLIDMLNMQDKDEAQEWRSVCTAVHEENTDFLETWFDKKLSQHTLPIILKVKDDTITMHPGIVEVSWVLRRLNAKNDFEQTSQLVYDEVSHAACQFINDHIRSLYILSCLFGNTGERAPQLIQNLCKSHQFTLHNSLFEQEELISEVGTVAHVLEIPCLEQTSELLNDNGSSRC